MDLNEYNDRLKGVLRSIEDEHPDIMLTLALDAVALIRERVQETGKDAKGGSFGQYSTKPMLAGRKSFLNKRGFDRIAGSKEKRKELQWRTISRGSRAYRLFIVPGGYKQVRELSGLPTKFKNFTFTGRMWNEITLRQSVTVSGKTAVIAPRTGRNIKALAGLISRHGEVLQISESEKKILLQNYDQRILKLFRRNGL